MWARWLRSFPELELLDLDVGVGHLENRALASVSPVAQAMLPYDERVLHQCLARLVAHEASAAAALAINESRKGALLPDIHLLAGAFWLAEGRCPEAADALRQCYQTDVPPGPTVRRLCPWLRLLLRVSPCVLLPLYPNAYGASLLYAVALWYAGAGAEALEVLREMATRWGTYDELRLVAGQVYLERDQLDRAVSVLTVQATTKGDAVELARCLYLAHAHFRREEFRTAARVLGSGIRLVSEVNYHLHARARLLLAELYERNGLLLNALRQSAHVDPSEVPADVAALMAQREERWVAELTHLTGPEIERLARADSYQVYLPDEQRPRAAYTPLDVSRDPLKRLRVKEMSWLKRQAEQREIVKYRAALARGETVEPPGEGSLSGLGLEVKQRIAAAERWWPGRRQALASARVRDQFARSDPAEVGHLRFDFCGSREAPVHRLQGEKRATLALIVAGSSLALALGLWLLRSCVYFF